MKIQAHSYAGIEDKNTFFTTAERATLVRAMLEMVRAKRRENMKFQTEDDGEKLVEIREGQPICAFSLLYAECLPTVNHPISPRGADSFNLPLGGGLLEDLRYLP